MIRKYILPMILVLLAFGLQPSEVKAQLVLSPNDTFKVLDARGKPGDIVPIKFYVANTSKNLAAFAAYIKMDTTVIEPLVIVDPVPEPDEYYFETDSIDRGLYPGLFMRTSLGINVPLTMLQRVDARDTIFGLVFALGDSAELPTGSGNLFQFFVRIKPNQPHGKTTRFRVFNPEDENVPIPGYQLSFCQYANVFESPPFTVERPVLRTGTLTVDTSTVVGPANQPPVIGTIPPAVNIQVNTQYNLSVTATDPNTAQRITLSASGLPTGASFGSGGSATGFGSAAGILSWTPLTNQIGPHTITFSCVDDSGSAAPTKSITITVSSIPISGDLLYTSSSRTLGIPAGGTPGLTGVKIPVALNTTQPVYGVQFDFVYPSDVIRIDSIVSTVRLQDFTVYDNLNVTPGRLRIVTFGLNSETVATGPTSAIFNLWSTVKVTAQAGEYPLAFENAWEAISSNPQVPSVELNFDNSGLFVVDERGDVNGDGRIDVADVVVVVAFIIGDVTLDVRAFSAADINNNFVVDVNDLVALLNIILGGGSPAPGIWEGPLAKINLGDENGLIQSGNLISLSGELPTDIAGVQLEINYNPTKMRFMMPRKSELTQNLNLRVRDNQRGKMVVLLYPGGGHDAHIQAGIGNLLDLTVLPLGEISAESGDITLSRAVLTDPDATDIPVEGFSKVALPESFTLEQNYPNPFNPQTTIEFTIRADAANRPVKLEVFNILGEKVATLLDKPLSAGQHTVQWLGRTNSDQPVASGVYFYRLQVGQEARTKKMVLIK